MDLSWEVEQFLKRTGTPPSRLGREVLGDPGLVRGLRAGRQLRPATAARLRAHLGLGDAE